jgi:hypothetical protein
MGWTLVEEGGVAVVGESRDSRVVYHGRLTAGSTWECRHDHLLPMQAERCARAMADLDSELAAAG